jgi:hypothetical protein
MSGSRVQSVIPAPAGIQGVSQYPLSWLPAFAGMTKRQLASDAISFP